MTRYSKTVGSVILTPTQEILCEYGPGARVATNPIGDLYGNLRAVLDRTATLAATHEITVLINWPGLTPSGDLGPWRAHGGDLTADADWAWFERDDLRVNVGLVYRMQPRKITLWAAGLPEWTRAVESLTESASNSEQAAHHLMPDPRMVASRLMRYQVATGAAFYINPAVSGSQSIRNLYTSLERGGQPYWGTRDRWYSAAVRGAGDLQHWERDPDLLERGLTYVHAYDTNRARLAAAGNAELAWGQLRLIETSAFDTRRAGFWRVRADHALYSFVNDPVRPPLFNAADIEPDGTVWLSTPVMKRLQDRGSLPEVLDALVEPDLPWGAPRTAKRLLRGWAKQLDDAIQSYSGIDPYLVDTLKLTYKRVFALMVNEGGAIFRPDWHDTVLDLERINALRKVDLVHEVHGIWPIRIHTDCLYYASDNPDPAAAIPELARGTKLGQWKLSTIAMSDWLEGVRA